MSMVYYRRYNDVTPSVERYYHKHIKAMTEEDLNSKADIAMELAYRDFEMNLLEKEIRSLKKENQSLKKG